MKRFLLGAVAAAGIAAALCGAPAQAADLPTKAPAYKAAPAPVDPWTGFYVGGSVGARWSAIDWTTVDFMGNGTPTSVHNPAALDHTTFRAGAYAGYNWRIAPTWLVGVEGDIAWGSNSRKTTSPFPGDPFSTPATIGHDLVGAQLGWDGSVRGRVGYLITPSWLVYATGGAAWQRITTSASCDAAPFSYCGVPIRESESTVKAGWTVGGGVETMLAAHWFARAEYRYADFGHVRNTFPPAPSAGFHASVSVKSNIALVGLAYKF